jgi:hypothetical protein
MDFSSVSKSGEKIGKNIQDCRSLERSGEVLSGGTISFTIAMSVHWKALEDHFLMVPLVSRLIKPVAMTLR